MKNKIWFLGLGLLASATLMAAVVITKVSQYPNVTTPGTNDFILLAITNAPGTNHNIKYKDLKAAINSTNVNGSGTATTVAYWSGTNTLGAIPDGEPGFVLTINSGGDLEFLPVAGGAGDTNIFDITIVTNNIFISGKGNTLVITNYIRLPVTTLTLTGTNVSAINLTNGSAFKLTLTTNAYIAAPTGLPGTNLIQGLQIFIQQDGTGSRTLTWHSAWKFPGGTAPTMTTTTNALDVYTFASSPIDATVLYGVPAQDIR